MKKISILLLLALPLWLAAAEESRTLKGVALPLSLQQDGKNLKLNGMGARTKVVFKVYVAGLYLEKTSSDGLEIAASEQMKRMELFFLRAVDGADVAAAIAGGFEKNAGPALPALKTRMEKFSRLIPDVKKGDRLVFTYRPGAGLEVQAGGKAAGGVEGKDFSDALFKVWLGAEPADKALKTGLLGL
ncbi:MAG TPA: chalcone isomerase family protein [Elusimicrobiales bacterium]|nr:chalcone isomerase family protein [Elusimicrobiales bacterium]